jgi:ubiquinone/menaquinone biosynthesis C-methylase UbiE
LLERNKEVPDYIDIYNNKAWKYDLLVSKEDYQGNLLKCIGSICILEGKHTVDLGAGTGRISFLLSPHFEKVFAFEYTPGMLEQARKKQQERKINNIVFKKGDSRRIKLKNNSIDLVIAGWSMGMMMVWNLNQRQSTLDRAFSEAERVLKKRGTIIIIETMGTMKTEPEPLETLIPLYNYLDQNGYKMECIRTDYQFDSVAEATDLCGFFFGESVGLEIQQKQLTIIPEHTGVWHKKKIDKN